MSKDVTTFLMWAAEPHLESDIKWDLKPYLFNYFNYFSLFQYEEKYGHVLNLKFNTSPSLTI